MKYFFKKPREVTGLVGPGTEALIEGKVGPREETDKVSFRA